MSPSTQTNDEPRLSWASTPSEIMRARRPELFSDTPAFKRPNIDPGLLEYCLETLTSRNQEQVFALFAHRLAELELCPNLRPQTGPTGGGDSGVDAGTYAVSPDLADRLYWGSPVAATTERWAFAFSTKKRWKDKVSSDVAKAASITPRYEKIFCIISAFARDKDRALVEAALFQRHGIPVEIFDRQWIVSRVVQNDRVDLLRTYLETALSGWREPQPGPSDAARTAELRQVLEWLSNDAASESPYFVAVEYLRAARLARGIGKPRAEVEGYYQRALSLSKNSSSPSLIIRALYESAWTAFWWFDDRQAVADTYSAMEPFLASITLADDFEKYCNLWSLLRGAVARNNLPEAQALTSSRAAELSRLAESLLKGGDKSLNSRELELCVCVIDLARAQADPSALKSTVSRIELCVRAAQKAGPVVGSTILRRIIEMADVLEATDVADELLRRASDLSRSFSGAADQGFLLFRRGISRLQRDPKGALLLLGEARLKFAQTGQLRLAARAAVASSDCYQQLGYLWASRSDALSAIHQCLSLLAPGDKPPIEVLWSATRLARVELQLGRIEPFIVWWRYARGIAGLLWDKGDRTQHHVDTLDSLDATFAGSVVDAPLTTLEQIGDISDVLLDIGLHRSAMALLYRNKGLSNLVLAGLVAAGDEEKARTVLGEWSTLSRSDGLQKAPLQGHRDWTLRSDILGVKYTITGPDAIGPIGVGEMILGTLEALLSTANQRNLAFIVSELRIVIGVDDSVDGVTFDESEPPDRDNRMLCGSNAIEWSRTKAAPETLQRLLFWISLGTTIDPIADLQNECDELAAHAGFNRAFGYNTSLDSLVAVLGLRPYDFHDIER